MQENAFLFAYFRGNTTKHGEQVYFAVSQPDSPLDFVELNSGYPVLISGVGEGGVRDPFLIRNQLTGRFHLLATDLRIYASKSWDYAARHGSRNLTIWDSPDLISWGPARAVTVSAPSAGCTWAPEAVFDAAIGDYVVVWASTFFGEDDPEHRGESHLRIVSSRTRDFRIFSEPATYYDPGYSVIDTTFIEHAGTIHRFSKDERAASEAAPHGKHVFHERGSGVSSNDYEVVQRGIGADVLAHGEGPVIAAAPDGESWVLLIDEFLGRGYVAFETDDLDKDDWRLAAAARLPVGARHGSLLSITGVERDRLLAAFGTPTT